MNINKQTYLGERGKANILLSSTVDGVFSITFEDEDNGVKSSWEMTMYRDDAEKVARKFAEMLGVIPIYDCRSCKNNGNERYCLDCHDYCNFVRYEARPQGVWIKHIDNLFPEESTEECPFCHEEQFIRYGNDDNYCPNCGAHLLRGDN